MGLSVKCIESVHRMPARNYPRKAQNQPHAVRRGTGAPPRPGLAGWNSMAQTQSSPGYALNVQGSSGVGVPANAARQHRATYLPRRLRTPRLARTSAPGPGSANPGGQPGKNRLRKRGVTAPVRRRRRRWPDAHLPRRSDPRSALGARPRSPGQRHSRPSEAIQWLIESRRPRRPRSS